MYRVDILVGGLGLPAHLDEHGIRLAGEEWSYLEVKNTVLNIVKAIAHVQAVNVSLDTRILNEL